MPVLQAPDRPQLSNTSRQPWWGVGALCFLLLLAIAIYRILIGAAPRRDDLITPFLQVWIISYLPYFAACAYVLATKPALLFPAHPPYRRSASGDTPHPGKGLPPSALLRQIRRSKSFVVGYRHWIELGIILAGAFIMRAMLLPLPPGLSHDSWRYLWDARVTLHGFSPYVYAPSDKALASLQDNLIYANSRFRNVPTIYPPGAQAIYLLSYLLAPSNLFFLKGIFLVFDMITCGALMVLLRRRGLDPRRAILYAWCPLPIVEFAIQGHVDVITLTFTILAVLAALNTRPGGRLLTGTLIGLATLTKLYPVLLLAVLPRRRDYLLLLACFTTIILGYLPYLILGHGQVFGFFATYASEQGGNAGVTQQFVYWLGMQQHLRLETIITGEHIVDVILLGSVSLVALALRLRERITMEAGTLLLSGTVLSISSHVFPWYTTALLLWVPLLLGPLWRREESRATERRAPTMTMRNKLVGSLSGKSVAVLATWYFTCTSLLAYFFNAGPANPHPGWSLYYALVYKPVVSALGVAALTGIVNAFLSRIGSLSCNHTPSRGAD